MFPLWRSLNTLLWQSSPALNKFTPSTLAAIDIDRPFTSSSASTTGNASEKTLHTQEEWWATMASSEIASRIDTMGQQQRCASLKAVDCMFARCQSAEEFSAAIRARKRMFMVARHTCSGRMLPADIAWQKARELRGPTVLLEFMQNLSSCGFTPNQNVFHEMLELMAQDAENMVGHLPAVIQCMAAHGAEMSPETCRLCCVVCLAAQKPAAASLFLDAYVGAGFRDVHQAVEEVKRLGVNLSPVVEAQVANAV